MLRRSSFKRQVYVPPPAAPLRPPQRWIVTTPVLDLSTPYPKESVIQHQGFMDLVRDMPCAHCGHPPRSDFAHADTGKGCGIKTDCRRGFPLCRSCHHLIGSTGKLGREERRRLELEYSASTRAKVIAAGTWPERLPMWEEVSA